MPLNPITFIYQLVTVNYFTVYFINNLDLFNMQIIERI